MKKVLLASLLAFTLMFAISTPSYAAGNFFSNFTHAIKTRWDRFTLILPGDKPGSLVMEQTMEASKNLNTANMDMSANIDLMKDQDKLANVTVDISAPLDMKQSYDPQTYRQAFSFSGEASMQGTSLKAAADARIIGQTVYFKINEAPQLPSFNLSPITGKWLKTETKASNNNQVKFTPDQEKRLADAYQKLLQDAQLGTAKKDTKNGEDIFVINAKFPEKSVSEYLDAVLEIQQEAMGKTASNTANQEAQKNIDQALQKIGDVNATMWVDRSSFYIVHTEVPFSVPIDRNPTDGTVVNPAAGPFAALNDINKVNVMVTVDMKDFNKPVQVDEPSDAQDAQQAFRQMMMGTMQQQQQFNMNGVNGGTSELPNLTPKQRLQLQQYQQMQRLQNQNLQPGTQVPMMPAAPSTPSY